MRITLTEARGSAPRGDNASEAEALALTVRLETKLRLKAVKDGGQIRITLTEAAECAPS
jgi:hypothetical protein